MTAQVWDLARLNYEPMQKSDLDDVLRWSRACIRIRGAWPI
jgi:hypothetical protein